MTRPLHKAPPPDIDVLPRQPITQPLLLILVAFHCFYLLLPISLAIQKEAIAFNGKNRSSFFGGGSLNLTWNHTSHMEEGTQPHPLVPFMTSTDAKYCRYMLLIIKYYI